MTYLVQRLQEPSTYAGIAALLASLGLLGFSEQDWNQILAVIGTIAAAIAMLLGERAKSGSTNE